MANNNNGTAFGRKLNSFRSLMSMMPNVLMTTNGRVISGNILPVGVFGKAGGCSISDCVHNGRVVFNLRLNTACEVASCLSTFTNIHVGCMDGNCRKRVHGVRTGVNNKRVMGIGGCFDSCTGRTEATTSTCLTTGSLTGCTGCSTVTGRTAGITKLATSGRLSYSRAN